LIFDSYLYFPFPNYAARWQLIYNFIKYKNLSNIEMLPIGMMSSITEGYTAGSVNIILIQLK
jgi:hypothetical protein